jgi:LL-diaminopimelate aminotransferase
MSVAQSRHRGDAIFTLLGHAPAKASPQFKRKTSMEFKRARRLERIPPYVFLEIDRLKQEAVARGEDIINLGIGDPDLPTPGIIIEALAEAARDPATHTYPLGAGMRELRQEIANYYERTRGVVLDPDSEVLALIGSKEGIAHFPWAFVDPGDIVLVPEPAYPVYWSSTIFSGGEPHMMPLRAENGFLPDLDAIPDEVYRRAKLMFLNYPNNPTAAFATRDFFERVVSKAKQHGFIVLHDAAYLDMAYQGERALSFMEIPGARDVGIELHSFSKTFNMTGWRLAFAAGNAQLVQALLALKSNLDSGAFGAIQRAGIVALRNYDTLIPPLLEVYESRLEALNQGMRELGWTEYRPPKGTFYAFLPTRKGFNSMEMAKELIRRCAIVTTPGTGFGSAGEGFFRITLTAPADRLLEACRRMKAAGF